MKTVFIIAFFAISLFAQLQIATTIEPIEFLIERVAKDKATVFSLVTKGASAHTYEPKPAQMKALAASQIYFAIGVEFEDVWLERFKNRNRELQIVRVDSTIKKLPSVKHHHHDDDHHHAKVDTHIWLSPKNMILIAKEIVETLIIVDAENQDFYMQNFKELETELIMLDSNTKRVLEPFNGRTILVFHPAWQYFVKEYDLVQVAIEIEGKEPKPKELQATMSFAKKKNIKAIFVHSNQSAKSAEVIAKNIGARVIMVDPLAKNYPVMIDLIAKEISEAMVD